MIVSCFSLQDVFSLWVFFFAGHCCKNTVIFTTETKGSVHLVRHWYSFFSNTTTTCIYGCQCHIWGWSIQLFLSLSLSLSHTHTHTHIIPLRCLLSQSLVEFLFWEWYEGWNFSFLCAKTLYTNPYRAQHINYGFFKIYF